MGTSTPEIGRLSHAAREFNWLLSQFAAETGGVTQALAVSADGLPIAVSPSATQADIDRLAAIVSGMTGLAYAASDTVGFGPPAKVIVDMPGGYLVIAAIGVGAVFGIIAEQTADVGTVAFEMTVFADQARAVLTPQLISELRTSGTS
jgi:predicted regulator of Ras-like GTPase activity (Roadblock/LC7/MglB family)